MKETLRFIICNLFHRKHRHRTGERRIRSVSIAYDLVCDKCGLEDTEIVFVEHLSN